jgi:hypothetical protein
MNHLVAAYLGPFRQEKRHEETVGQVALGPSCRHTSKISFRQHDRPCINVPSLDDVVRDRSDDHASVHEDGPILGRDSRGPGPLLLELVQFLRRFMFGSFCRNSCNFVFANGSNGGSSYLEKDPDESPWGTRRKRRRNDYWCLHWQWLFLGIGYARNPGTGRLQAAIPA